MTSPPTTSRAAKSNCSATARSKSSSWSPRATGTRKWGKSSSSANRPSKTTSITFSTSSGFLTGSSWPSTPSTTDWLSRGSLTRCWFSVANSTRLAGGGTERLTRSPWDSATLRRTTSHWGDDRWFRSSAVIGYPVGSLCFLLHGVTWFSLLLGAYCSEIVPKSSHKFARGPHEIFLYQPAYLLSYCPSPAEPVLFSLAARGRVLMLSSSLT